MLLLQMDFKVPSRFTEGLLSFIFLFARLTINLTLLCIVENNTSSHIYHRLDNIYKYFNHFLGKYNT